MAVLFTVVIPGFGRYFFTALGGRGAVLDHALAYSTVIFSGAFAIWLMNMLASAIRGSGNMLVPAAVILTVAALQVGLGGALVLGWGPFPRLGIAGAGVAQEIGRAHAELQSLMRISYDVFCLKKKKKKKYM